MIFGRTTYELMASYWPTAEADINDPGVADAMRNSPKIVISKTMPAVADGPNWKNITVWHEIDPAKIAKLKERESGEIAVFGSGTIVQQLAKLGLIDEYRLLVNPIILGAGKPLFKDAKKVELKLLSTRTFGNGNILLCYQPLKS